MRHRLIQESEIRWGDVLQQLENDSFQISYQSCAFLTLHSIHLTPEIFNWVQVRTVALPPWERMDAKI